MAPKNPSPPKPSGTALAKGNMPSLAAPTQTSGDETTLFFDIDLKNAAPPMTAVYLPAKFTSGALDLLVYFHGWKTDKLDGKPLGGMSADQFLTVPTFDFRKMIQGTKKRQFALVLPTLGDHAESGDLAKTGDTIEAFLDMVRQGIGTFLPTAKSAPTAGNLVVAAHSGGGDTLFNFASRSKTDTGTRGSIRELWCFDCTYSHGSDFLPMLPDYTGKDKNPLPGLVKLWMVSTGMIATTKKALQDPKLPKGPDNPLVDKPIDSGTGDNAHAVLEYAQAAAKSGKAQTTTVSVYHAGLFHWDKSKDRKANEVNYTGYKHPSGHNQSVGENLPALITNSTILK